VSKFKCKCRRVILTGQELVNQRIERKSAPNRTLADRLPKRKRIYARLHAQSEGFGERADDCIARHIVDELGRRGAADRAYIRGIEVYCPEYQTTATIRINDAHSSGTDHLEVDYRSPDHSHFTIEIPDDWTDQDLLELIFLPPRDPGRQNWPAWEIPAYDLVSSRLFRFWKGEKKPDK
jgi:hypothetical protein